MINHEERLLRNQLILLSFALVCIIFCTALQVDWRSYSLILALLALLKVELAQPLLVQLSQLLLILLPVLSFIFYSLLLLRLVFLLFEFQMIEGLHA